MRSSASARGESIPVAACAARAYRGGMYERTESPVRATLYGLPDGDQGTRATLTTMQRLAEAGARDPDVRATAIEIVTAAGAQGHDPETQAGALHEFVRDRVLFVSDVAGVETLQSPRVTLRVMAGDCDDRATLLAAMLRAIGIPSRFRVIAADPRRPRSFSHVYVVARVGSRDIALDPTYRSNAAGWQYPLATRAGDFRA